MEEKKYYSFNDILKFIGIPFDFEDKREYPFTKGIDNVVFSWGQILIPKKGIKETVECRLSDKEAVPPLKEISMMYQLPFKVIDKQVTDIGIINQNISLSFRYDKEWKYGEINKNIYEVCFFILENSYKSNDFYIITGDMIQYFFSNYIINNQWGLGCKYITSPPAYKFETDIEDETEAEAKQI